MSEIIDTAGLQQVPGVDLGAPQPKPTATTPGLTEATLPVWSGGKIETGVWECGVGSFTAVRDGYTEICYLISGEVTITAEGAAPRTYRGGDIVVMPSGWRGTWDVHTPVRKHYIVMDD